MALAAEYEGTRRLAKFLQPLVEPGTGPGGCGKDHWSPAEWCQVSAEIDVIRALRFRQIERLAIPGDRAFQIANANHDARNARVLRAGRFAGRKRALVTRREILNQ